MSEKEEFENWLVENGYRFMHVNLASIEEHLYSMWVVAKNQGRCESVGLISSIQKYDTSVAGDKVTRAYFQGFNSAIRKCFDVIGGVEK